MSAPRSNASQCARHTLFTPSSVARSAATASTSPPRARSSASAARRRSARRAQMVTRPPSAASAAAIAFPMPALEPVTSARLPASRRSIARALGVYPGDHGGCGERSGGCERRAHSSLLRRAYGHASSVVAALTALAPRLVRLARHGHPDRLLSELARELGSAVEERQQRVGLRRGKREDGARDPEIPEAHEPRRVHWRAVDGYRDGARVPALLARQPPE